MSKIKKSEVSKIIKHESSTKYTVEITNKFKSDFVSCVARGCNSKDLIDVVKILAKYGKLPPEYKAHPLKGYKTNTKLSAQEVYEEYQNLWNVERSFRIVKGTLEIRPIFHFTTRRIEAHVCICFVALKVYKELERLLKASHSAYSIDDVLRIAETIVTLEIARPENNDTCTKTLCITDEERAISYLIT